MWPPFWKGTTFVYFYSLFQKRTINVIMSLVNDANDEKRYEHQKPHLW